LLSLLRFPLLSKSSHLQKLEIEVDEESSGKIDLIGFLAGPRVFEICAKFCCGMIITLNAHIVALAHWLLNALR